MALWIYFPYLPSCHDYAKSNPWSIASLEKTIYTECGRYSFICPLLYFALIADAPIANSSYNPEIKEGTMKELVTEIEIQASAEKVWQILTDFPAYSSWNSFLYQIDGKAEKGQTVVAHFRSVSSREMTFRCTIDKLEPKRELRWKYHVLSPFLFQGEHSFTIELVDANRVRFVQREVFKGLLIPFFAKGIDADTKRDFAAMDQALKARAEQVK